MVLQEVRREVFSSRRRLRRDVSSGSNDDFPGHERRAEDCFGYRGMLGVAIRSDRYVLWQRITRSSFSTSKCRPMAHDPRQLHGLHFLILVHTIRKRSLCFYPAIRFDFSHKLQAAVRPRLERYDGGRSAGDGER